MGPHLTILPNQADVLAQTFPCSTCPLPKCMMLRSCCHLQFCKILVQTADTVRYSHLLSLAVQSHYPCLFVGPTGTGKSVYILKYINSLDNASFVAPIVVGLSARTSATMAQSMIDAKLDRRRKGVYGPTAGKKVVCFVDDLNMPQLEQYGAQPPIELLRQFMDHGGWCDVLAVSAFQSCCTASGFSPCRVSLHNILTFCPVYTRADQIAWG
jgi:hypothetical protein